MMALIGMTPLIPPRAYAFKQLHLICGVILALALGIEATHRIDQHNGLQFQRARANPLGALLPLHLPEGNEHVDQSRPSIRNLTCSFFTQPLNHFVPRGRSPSYQERYCIYSEFARNETSPILFYTGNESPLEQYINHTGLMWELGSSLQARLVFAEHRYEGQSLPNVSSQCLSYASTIQAIADYANLITHINPDNKSPVIVFGGSYGGMLSAWMRMKYPHLVTGAIAASAPLGAFPHTANNKIDWSARVLQSGMNQRYPPNIADKDSATEAANHCSENLLAAWPLITYLLQQKESNFIQDTFRLCEPLAGNDPLPLLGFCQTLWFDLAEGSFPYPSNYIPFALIHKKVNLPPWPLQSACWKSRLHEDWGVRFSGNTSEVRYEVSYGDSNITLNVDWDTVSSKNTSVSKLAESSDLVGLLGSVRDAIGIWHNITKDVSCYNVSEAAPNQRLGRRHQERQLRRSRSNDPTSICTEKMKEVGSWEPVCCNDEINLVITEASGLGHDFFWPPSHPKGVKTYEDLIRNATSEPCPDPLGLFGYSAEPYDLRSEWLRTYYSEINMSGHSNIVFSNGLLDPWAAGGVYARNPFSGASYDGPMVQQINENDVVAVLIEYGGHHTDLMFSSKYDPACVRNARRVEREYIVKWMEDWKRRDSFA